MDWPPDRYEEQEDERPMPEAPRPDGGRDRFSEAVGDAWESAIWQERYVADDPD